MLRRKYILRCIMKVYVSVTAGTKKICEDSAFVNNSILTDSCNEFTLDNFCCVGVADGVGGNAGGRIASRYIAHQFGQSDVSRMTKDEIRVLVDNINAELINQAATIPDKADMATTLTCVVTTKEGYVLIHAGNTRLYVMQGSYLKQLTADHTTYSWLMEFGQYEAAEQCNKSEINCCLGGGNTRYANRLVVEKLFDECPDTLVLTSDGIHEFVDIDSIEDALTTAESDEEAVRLITEKAIQNGSTDDKSIIILRR